MTVSDVGLTSVPAARADKLLAVAAMLPRPVRFLGVGGLGLITDLSLFTALAAYGVDPLLARAVSLAAATGVTWRLNRALTFDPSRRRQRDEAVRYAGVTVTAQGASYALFAALVVSGLAEVPQVALLIGAGVGAVIAYTGHRFFAFAPRKPFPAQKATCA